MHVIEGRSRRHGRPNQWAPEIGVDLLAWVSRAFEECRRSRTTFG